MKFNPHPYQKIITDFAMAKSRCNVWADMGMGKTSSMLAALDGVSLYDRDPFPAIVIAPLRVARDVWPAEVRKWADFHHLKVSTIVGDETTRTSAVRAAADIYVANYDILQWLVYNCYNKGAAWPFRTVVADESSKLKNFRMRGGTIRATALARVAFHSRVQRWVNLTGTPAPNGLIDLWGQQWFVDHGKALGMTFTSYVERFFRPRFNGFGYEPLPFAEQQIYDLLKPTSLTIRAADWLPTDAPIRQVSFVKLPQSAMKIYREMEKKMYFELEGVGFEAFGAAAKTNKCLQLSNGAVYTNEGTGDFAEVHKAKLEALEEIIEEAAGASVLVAYNFKSDLARLQKAFKAGRDLRKSADFDDWNAGKIRVGFIHPASAGHGINLQYGGNRLVFFGLNWNLEEHLQVIERIGPVRQKQAGFDRPVYVHYLVGEGTVDEVVMKRLTTKREVQDLLREAMKWQSAA